MPYLYENLDAEKFQHFCQALLAKVYPDLQCFPVGQPDGGRDALSRGSDDALDCVVGQIKFKRADEEENAPWMIAALTKELPKINRLIERGATRYIMMTNASGTSHLDVGRIDLVQSWLDEHVPIPAMVLWRDDLDGRVDGDLSIKLSYPAILTGADALTLIVTALAGPERDRVGLVLRAFVAGQYSKDEEVKFRQVELANSLLALFVDVPTDVGQIAFSYSGPRVPLETREAIRRLALPSTRPSGLDYDSGPSINAGTADLLLDADVQAGLPWIVLHGAPGQGKSTLAQYVCQVHRARYLGKTDFINQLPSAHRAAPFRLPIKVDLRDFAGYLEGKKYLGVAASSPTSARTLEKFLASLISIQSGGLDYSASDFASTAAGIPILLFLDGLDEVADLEARKAMIDKVVEGLNRLKENGADLQVVVTSRPSLFGRAPSFAKTFVKLDLAPIDDATIEAYADKWVVARRLDKDRGDEVRRILSEKLELAHIRELTKNPMQLTILLSLILSIGHSLPDVRTDLYREYMNLFMTREAEKSPIVREHRALLLEIVEYIAWLLQSGAETDRTSGSISAADIRTIIADYLVLGEHSSDILDDLFTGGLERVYVLVQRVEGLYEFEVQPLREYFAAKHLYSSAPVGTFRHLNVSGDRAQRFEAIASNPYWANVTRFYAGFYEGGEIGALGSSLRELSESKDLGASLNARSVGATLLTDWIFRSKKFVQKDVIQLVFDPLGVALASISRLSGFEGATLDKQCGRDVLSELLFRDYVTKEDSDQPIDACSLLRRNGGSELSTEFDEWVSSSIGKERTTRLRKSARSGGTLKMTSDAVEHLVVGDEPSASDVHYRLRALAAWHPGWLAQSDTASAMMLTSILDWGGFNVGSPTSDVARFATLLSAHPYGRIFRDKDFATTPRLDSTEPSARLNITLRQIDEVLETSSSSRWDDAERWSSTIEAVRSNFGDSWATYRMAILTIGLIKSGSIKTSAIDVDDVSLPLFVRAMAGKNWKGNPSWWIDRLADSDEGTRLFWVAILFLWAPTKQVVSSLPRAAEIVAQLGGDDLERLAEVLHSGQFNRRVRGGRTRGGVPIVDPSDSKVAYFLLVAFGDVQLAYLPDDLDGNTRLSALVRQKRIEARLAEFPGWHGLTPKKTAAFLDLCADARIYHASLSELIDNNILDIRGLRKSDAHHIVLNAGKYPIELVSMAHSAVQTAYAPSVVEAIARDENWNFN